MDFLIWRCLYCVLSLNLRLVDQLGLIEEVAKVLIIDEKEIRLDIALLATEARLKRAWGSDDAPALRILLGLLSGFHFTIKVEISDFYCASELREHLDLSSLF